MTTIRVDAYPGYLDSIEMREYDSPYTLLETISAAAINEVALGAYEVTSALVTGNWMMVLLDSASNGLGIKYSSSNYLHAQDTPPWVTAEQTGTGSETVILTIKDTSAVPIAQASVYISSDALGAVRVEENLSSDSEGKVIARLDPGTYYVWASKTGETFNNPTQIVVTDV